ncbi:hypothetical protein cypCar_00026688, partial [Cyprinus carpio]
MEKQLLTRDSVTMDRSESVYCLFLLQVYDENDVRRARFVGRQKEVKGDLFNGSLNDFSM